MNIGDYVRTIYGEIFKVVEPIKQIENYILVDTVVDRSIDRDCNDNWLKIGEIIKYSKNIKDLLEDGDYIKLQDRGWRFYEVTTDYESKLAIIDIGWNEYEDIADISNQEIVSIVTHQQMEEMEYKVNE